MTIMPYITVTRMRRTIAFLAAVISLSLFVGGTAFSAVSVSVIPTGDNTLAGGGRKVHSLVSGATSDNSVTWTTSCGSKVDNTGFTVWTAPGSATTCTVTATSVEDGTKNAVATFVVWDNATVRLSNIPSQATVFKNQPIVIQSILWGSTNTAVTWDNSGGTLTGTGREVVFSSSSSGTYTITSTSGADGTKTGTTTVVVTDNAWSGSATPNRTMPIDCQHVGSGTAYEVHSEADWDSVPWNTLGAGDTVMIYSDVVYHKQANIKTSGTASQPIRICGVPADNGALPEISGANATSAPGQNYGPSPNSIQGYGGIVIYLYGSSYYGGAVYPNYIIIEGLKFSGFHESNTYTDLNDNTSKNYVGGAASIRSQHSGNLSFRGNEVTGCGNGIFAMASNNVESKVTRNLLVEGNYFHGNGVDGDYLEHQNYLQAFGLVVQGNYYGRNLTGALGGQLKARAVQGFYRYNYFEPAARMFDLVEEQDDNGMVFPWYGIDANELVNTSRADIVANLEAYQDPFVYGNILHNFGSPATGWMVHGAADTGDQKYNYGGTIYFYHNTVHIVVAGSIAYRSGIFDFGPYQYALSDHTTWPIARVTNNAIYTDATVSPYDTIFFLNRYRSDRVALDKNWISTAWGTGNSTGGDGTGIASTNPVNPAYTWQMGTINTQVYGTGNLIGDTSLPFSATTYIPTAAGPLVGASASLPGKAAALPPMMQYNPSTYLMTQRTAITDIGAVQYSEAGDTTPDPFSWDNIVGAELSTPTESGNTTSIIGMDNGASISISGTGCEYAVDGSGYSTSTPSTIDAGQYVVLRVTSSDTHNTFKSCTFTAGTRSQVWTVLTHSFAADLSHPRGRFGGRGRWR